MSLFDGMEEAWGIKTIHSLYQYRMEGKAIPLQALTGLEDSRRSWLPYFKTFGT